MITTAKYAWSFSRNSSFLRGLFYYAAPCILFDIYFRRFIINVNNLPLFAFSTTVAGLKKLTTVRVTKIFPMWQKQCFRNGWQEKCRWSVADSVEHESTHLTCYWPRREESLRFQGKVHPLAVWWPNEDVQRSWRRHLQPTALLWSATIPRAECERERTGGTSAEITLAPKLHMKSSALLLDVQNIFYVDYIM